LKALTKDTQKAINEWKIGPGMVVHVFSPRTQQTDTGRSQSKTLKKTHKSKRKERWNEMILNVIIHQRKAN
jgi:hypothetical protein